MPRKQWLTGGVSDIRPIASPPAVRRRSVSAGRDDRSRFPKIAPAATRRFPSLARMGYMRVNQAAKGLNAGDGRAYRRQPLISSGFRLAGLIVGVVAASVHPTRVSHHCRQQIEDT
ncbi:MAG: hypothetical protein AAFX07_13070 [Pseudomonadota bacterium]